MTHDPKLSARFDRSYVPEPNSGCWLWMGPINPNGYGTFCDKPGMRSAHRASYAMHKGPIQSGLLVCHRCDVRSCVNPDHLFLGTPKDNLADAAQKGRTARGEGQGKARLTARQVDAIRSEAGSITQRQLARKYGVGQATINHVLRRNTWGHQAGETPLYSPRPGSVVTQEMVDAVKSSDLPQRHLAKMLGISQATVGRIRKAANEQA